MTFDFNEPVWILASASPRRRDILAAAGQRFEVRPSAAPEPVPGAERPRDYVRRVARAKAEEVGREVPGRWILAADTVVVAGDTILGKPLDGHDARAMLRRLSAREHEVLTAWVLLDPSGACFRDGVVSTSVRFRALTTEEIEAYVEGGEPLDKAGAYAIQGEAKAFVERFDGSHTNVIGLPLDQVREACRAAGLWREGGEGS